MVFRQGLSRGDAYGGRVRHRHRFMVGTRSQPEQRQLEESLTAVAICFQSLE
ncbi:hypothetical protein LC653_36465 [Nostoc sp. CHAB 5784]|uniref:hypothetical protein n=1 Tax=Nostoc mirabile TaxID=2907820 RepID=UPI001E379EDA|nr:hypothetical protein [Nostoc mirabile]MCC5669193.1 hypothetical protein [Nostoc mirabile CHAB5784]